MTAPRHAAPTLDIRLLRSPRYWLWVLAVAGVLLAAGAAALLCATTVDDLPAALRWALGAAGVWGVALGLLGARLAQRYRAGEPPSL